MRTATALAQRLRSLAFPAALLIALEFYTRVVAPHSDALAPPSAAVLAFIMALRDGSLIQATTFTLAAATTGLLIGGGLGLLLGVALGLSQRAARTSFLTIEVLRPMPSVALIPLSMLMFGFGLQMEQAVIAFATFWPMLILTQAAVRQVEPQLLEASRSLGLGPIARTTKIVLPAIVPRLFVALRLEVAIALVVAVTVEIAANPRGVGYAMILAQETINPALVLAWLLWVGALGYGINALMLRLQTAVERRMGGAP